MQNIFILFFSALLAFGIPNAEHQEIPHQVQEKYVQFGNISLYTEAYHSSPNAKEAIIFLHGMGGSYQDASFLYNEKNPYMTISMDLLNHGKSGHVEQVNWDNYLEAVNTVIQSYHIEHVHLVGHSLGADVALMFTKRHPEIITDIMLLDRGYFNFSEVIPFNVTPSFLKVVEYNPDSGLDEKAFNSLIEMQYSNDITKTWDVKQRVLLIAANPYWAKPVEGQPNIVDIVAMIKKKPTEYGFTPERVTDLPDFSHQNLNDYMNFLDIKVNLFTSNNEKFDIVQTPFAHAMVYNENAKSVLLDYVVRYIQHDIGFLFENQLK